jgi:predicted nucleic acid-binding protein
VTALDTNIVVAIFQGFDEVFRAVVRFRAEGRIVACPVVFSELLANRERSVVEAFFERGRVGVEWALPLEVWATAGAAYREYAVRRREPGGGEPRRILADFLIGAHALSSGGRLLTLDPGFYRTNFPGLEVHEP